MNGRIYRVAWAVAAVPLLLAAFTVGQAEPLPPAALPPTFDETTAVQFATELARRFPDRRPGTPGARGAAAWVIARLADYRIQGRREPFAADVPGLGRRELVNVVAVLPGRSPDTIVLVAHRDNSGLSPGVDDNASGTAALLELARDASTAAVGGTARLPFAHTFVFVSTDGGAYGGLGAAQFARESPYARRTVALVNLDALGGTGGPRLEFGSDTPRSPAATLLATAEASVEEQAETTAGRPGAFAQMLDLAFPFSLYEQAPFVARGTPAVTMTTSGDRPRSPDTDTLQALRGPRLAALGSSSQALVMAIDQGADIPHGTGSFVYTGTRLIRGWTIEFALLAALVPILAATIDLFARCRRRAIRLAPGLRSYRSRVGVWAWVGLVFLLLVALGVIPTGPARPLNPDTSPAGDWSIGGLIVLTGLGIVGWLVARPRLTATHPVSRPEELGGHLAAMLALCVMALVVAAVNPYALFFLLPSLHAWLWLPHWSDRPAAVRVAVTAIGLLGPLVLLLELALRFGLGFDAPWYLVELAAVGYIPVPLLVAGLAWGAAGGQIAALAAGRYAPYPEPEERAARGPIRETIRQLVLFTRGRRRRAARRESTQDPEALEEP